MSKLEELLKRECPDGVEYKKLINVCDIKRGERITKKDIKENEMFPIISGGQFPMGMYDKFNRDENTITIASYGSAGYVDYQTKKFWANDVCLCLYPKIKLLNKFLYYYLKFKQDFLYSKTTNAIPNHIPTDIIKELLIPLPPIEIQKEIVGILDTFTKYQDLLNRELELRKKQYEYYNNKLLTFNDNVEYKTLEELCDIVDYRGKTPKKVNSGIFLITAKNIRKGYIDYEKSKEYVDINDYPNIMHRGLPQIGDVLITTEAPLGYVAQIDRENVALAQRVIKYRPKDKSLLSSYYLKYILLGKEFQDKLLINATGGTVKGIKGSKLHKLTIPVPPLEEQERIVNILDKFDALCNDITRGLPAEIEMRKKQYEYYRDKLLTFKEKKK
ncbi:restriction endonuclease subunit S [Brachyspira pilosicoli]|uniref:Putative restriction endonuclease type I, S subunit n=1 Tax=Brachyspira pilosicoli (strain ATCC BAA-1826 / 95/1000) TaxID=759914 RepID=D8IDC3_BRAP9|nr:restriction endonuclease subunit S [Brachyspira pilosicoli]ADK31146.1 putative restriction endonuclease type I, S subunit [Brachyspira pilosicoli 95/1000]